MRLKVDSFADVVRYTVCTTALAVVVPVTIVAIFLLPLRDWSRDIYLGGLIVATLIPLLITPPIAGVLLWSLLMLSETIKRVDGHVKFDNLTGILNRGHFLDSVRASRRNGMILIVDADHFKTVNDDLGHDAGDEALKMLAQRLSNAVESNGIVGRLGGEEFGIFLPDFSHESAATTAEQICDHVRTTLIPVGDVRLRLTVSIGGAAHKENAPLGHTLKLADQRLYMAKNAGRDRFVIEGQPTLNPRPVALKSVGS
jgi:diguanylate cyclase